MKSMKKLFALVMAAAMVLSMAVTSGAAGGTITVNKSDTAPAITYDIYKVFDAEEVPNNPGHYRYKLNSAWSGFTAPDFFKVENGYVIWAKDSFTVAQGAALATLAKNYLPSSATPVETVAGGSSANITENGYFLLVPQTPHESTPSGIVLLTDEGATITQKDSTADLPNVTKEVQEDSDSTWGDSNTADMGQTINFKTTIAAAAGAAGYVLHDKMDDQLTFIDVTNVTIKGDTAEDTDYTVDTDPDDDCTFHIVFDDSAISGLKNDDEIVVEYTAYLNSTAKSDTAYKNETWLIHTGDAETNHDITTSETFQIDFEKIFKDNGTKLKPVPGATFVLKKGNLYFSKDGNGLVNWVADKTAAFEFTTTEDNAEYSFTGLDSDDYTIVEIVVPGGFTGADDAPVKVNDSNAKASMENIMGVKLPETGGMGTTLFYVGGGALVLCAMFLLIGKKRAR